jgi:hypothetical protein
MGEKNMVDGTNRGYSMHRKEEKTGQNSGRKFEKRKPF